MAPKQAANSGPNVEILPIGKLRFDEENPRLVEIGDFTGLSEDEKAVILWRDMAAEEIANSMAQHGYYPHEPLFAEKKGPSEYTVIEGNRRLAALKVLLSPRLREKVRAEDLSSLPPGRKKQLQELPVVVTTRQSIWHYIGFKHVNGPRPWGAYSKAEYIAKVHNEFHVSLEDISRQIGDGHSIVRRLYRGLMALEQAEKNRVFDRQERWNKRFFFSHLYTGLGSKGIQAFLSLKEKSSYKTDPVPKSKVENLGELCVWLYGSKSRERPPLIRSQNPDLNSLAEALQTQRGTDALRAGLPLQTAVEASRGDERLLREAMIAAKEELRTAVGTTRTGYDGKDDLLEMAKDISSLAKKLFEDMSEMHQNKAKTRARSRK